MKHKRNRIDTPQQVADKLWWELGPDYCQQLAKHLNKRVRDEWTSRKQARKAHLAGEDTIVTVAPTIDPPLNTKTLARRIVELVNRKDHVSFVELAREWPEHFRDGELALYDWQPKRVALAFPIRKADLKHWPTVRSSSSRLSTSHARG